MEQSNETDLAQRWWQLLPHTILPLIDGRHCLLTYAGQPGGPAGPDVNDAVLCFLPEDIKETQEPWQQIAGSVEFHVRASDWFGHGHQHDARYNQVILHVVQVLDSPEQALRQDGTVIPTCALSDLPAPRLSDKLAIATSTRPFVGWLCQKSPLKANVLTASLLYAGLQRLGEKSLTMRADLETARGEHNRKDQANNQASSDISHVKYAYHDLALLPALAEGLGYGRDRDFMRAAGLRLLGLTAHIPEPLGRALEPALLDIRRLQQFTLVWRRWRVRGGWTILRESLLEPETVKGSCEALRAALQPLGRARADILIINIVLPFALAVAGLENELRLSTRAYQVYLGYPELTSNRVTRMMSAQLQLSAEPEQAALQQGLHHIYTHTCQSKNCQDCLCGGARL